MSAPTASPDPDRPLNSEQRGMISNALINFAKPETDDDFRALEICQREIEAAVEGDLHPWKAVQ